MLRNRTSSFKGVADARLGGSGKSPRVLQMDSELGSRAGFASARGGIMMVLYRPVMLDGEPEQPGLRIYSRIHGWIFDSPR